MWRPRDATLQCVHSLYESLCMRQWGHLLPQPLNGLLHWSQVGIAAA